MAQSDTSTREESARRSGGFINPYKPSHKWWVAGTVCVSSFLVTMSQVAVQVALPQIMTVYGLNIDQAQWIVTAYIIAGATLVHRHLGQQATVAAYQDCFMLVAMLCLASMPLVLLFRTPKE